MPGSSRTSRVTRWLMIGAAVLAPACKREAPPPAGPRDLVVHAADYSFTAPDTVVAGLTRIRLISSGPSLHHLQLARLDSGKTVDSVMAALRRPGPPPGWMHVAGGPNPGVPGDTTEIVTALEAGTYAMLCFVPDSAGMPHVFHGMARALTVVPATGPAVAEGPADVEIALSDFTFTESTPLTAGKRTVRVRNNGPQDHEMFIAKLDSGVTAQQLLTWVNTGMHGRPPARPLGGVSAIAPGMHADVILTLTPGDYALICFLSDATDGREHAMHGMIKQIRVS